MDPFQIPLYPSWSKLDDLNGHFLEEHIIRTTSPEIEQVNGMPPKSDSSLRLKSTTTRRREVSGQINPYPTSSRGCSFMKSKEASLPSGRLSNCSLITKSTVPATFPNKGPHQICSTTALRTVSNPTRATRRWSKIVTTKRVPNQVQAYQESNCEIVSINPRGSKSFLRETDSTASSSQCTTSGMPKTKYRPILARKNPQSATADLRSSDNSVATSTSKNCQFLISSTTGKPRTKKIAEPKTKASFVQKTVLNPFTTQGTSQNPDLDPLTGNPFVTLV
eukprot:GHVP01042502.1.p1 GENE.GHVP01042502.1~~GHVP01042502.1.p1  ORF type:complete len:278 (-),score=13.31 GHVP01042502.1:153-986(-)